MQPLESYRISNKFGVVIEEPMRKLPYLFHPWQEVMNNLRDLLQEKTVEKAVEELPLLDASGLSSHKELCLAHLQLALMASAYVWGRGLKNPPSVLPKTIAVPLYKVSCSLGLPPVLTHADLFCANVYVSSPVWTEKSDVELGLLYKFSSSRNWEALCTTVAKIEMRFGDIIPHIVRAAELSQRMEPCLELVEALRAVLQGVRQLKVGIGSLNGTLNPEFFFYHIQPFLFGWNEEVPALKSGLIYEGVSDTPITCPSASVIESPILPICDALLGINPERAPNLQGMIKEHRQFVDDLSRTSRIKQIVIESDDKLLADIYIRLVAAVNAFRIDHSNLILKSMNTRHGRVLVI